MLEMRGRDVIKYKYYSKIFTNFSSHITPICRYIYFQFVIIGILKTLMGKLVTPNPPY